MILGIYGESKSGKTTLVVELIKALKERGFSAATVKNIHMDDFSVDSEDKDTWEHSRAGAEVVVANSEDEAAFLVNYGMVPEEIDYIIHKICDTDILIVEGYWHDSSPKIAVGDIQERPNTVMRYKDNFNDVLGFAVEGIETERVSTQLPGLDCGKCGYERCMELAGAIRLKEKTFSDCEYFSEKIVSLVVDGKEVPLGKFAKEIVAGTVAGMVSTLKGVSGGMDIKIEIKG